MKYLWMSLMRATVCRRESFGAIITTPMGLVGQVTWAPMGTETRLRAISGALIHDTHLMKGP